MKIKEIKSQFGGLSWDLAEMRGRKFSSRNKKHTFYMIPAI